MALLSNPRFRVLVVAGFGLALLTMNDAFVYLVLQRRMGFGISYFPLLFVVTALLYMLLAIPFGRLADRFGRGRVFIGGYAVLALVYASLLLPAIGPLQVIVTLGLLGAYYAMTDGVLAALASAILPSELRGSGLGLLGTATGVARLIASVLFGVLWTFWDVTGAVTAFLVGLVLLTVIGGLILSRRLTSPTNA